MDFLKEKATKGSAKQEKSLQNNKWYVNVDEDLAKFQVGKDHFTFIDQNAGPYGPVMEIEATLHSNNTKKDYDADWTLESDSNNIDPALQGSPKASLRKQTTTEEKKIIKNKETNESTEIRRFFKNQVDLSDIGGDRHTVICTKKNKVKKDRQILQLEFETWRRLWYTIFWTDNSQTGVVNEVADIIKSAFEKAKIDLVHVPAQNKLDFDHEVFAIISTHKRDEDINKVMHGGQYPALQRKPFHLQVVLVKGCSKTQEIDSKVLIVEKTDSRLVSDKGEISGVKVRIPALPDVVEKYDPRILFTDDGIEQFKKVRGDLFRFEKTIRSLTYEISGQPKVTKTGPFLAERIDNKELVFHLGGPYKHIADAIKQGNSVTLEFTLEVMNVSPAGQNQGNKIVVQTHRVKDSKWQCESPEHIAKTLIHEIGHALGLVPEGDFRWKHSSRYTGHGGVGSHCNYNAELIKGIYAPPLMPKGKLCVMYHEINPQAGPEFCADCMKYLKFTKLRKASLKSPLDKGWIYTS